MKNDVDWLVMLGLYETARILFPEEAGHFTDSYIDSYIDFIVILWDRREE